MSDEEKNQLSHFFSGNEQPHEGNGQQGERTEFVSENVKSSRFMTGFAKAASGSELNREQFLESLGGVRGIFEAILPGMFFLIIYTVTHSLLPAVFVALAIAVLFVVIRKMTKKPILPAVNGLVSIAICVAFSLISGKAETFYVPGFFSNGISFTVLIVSIFLGWPLIGLIVGFLTGKGLTWKKNPRLKRLYSRLTLLWAALFFARLAVQLPLFFSHNVQALGVARLVMGVPLYSLVLLFTWLIVRALSQEERAKIISTSR